MKISKKLSLKLKNKIQKKSKNLNSQEKKFPKEFHVKMKKRSKI